MLRNKLFINNSKKVFPTASSLFITTPIFFQQQKGFFSKIFGKKSSPPKEKVLPDQQYFSEEELKKAQQFQNLNAPKDVPSQKQTQEARPPTAHALCQATIMGDLEEVKDLMKRGAPANIAPNSSGLTALHTAVAAGQLHIVDYILTQAPTQISPVFTATRDNITPLHVACTTQNAEVVEYLCKKIKELNVPPQKLPDGRLVDPIDMRANEERVTPLHLAVKFSTKEVIEILLRYGANPTTFSREEEPQSPISVACVRGDLEMLKTLFLAAVKILDERQVVELASPVSGTTPLQMASSFGHLNIVKFLIEECDADPRKVNDLCPHPPIYLAAYSGHAEVVKYFLENPKCGPMKPDEMQVTEGVSPLHAACRCGSVETVKILLEHGADRYLARKDTGIVPLHLAALHGHVEVIKLLIPPTTPLPKLPLAEKKGYTSLHLCLIGKHNDVLEYLFQIGFAPECQARADERRILPLHIAAETGNTRAVKMILEHISRDVINAKDITGGTALHAASYSGNIECVELLLKYGADMAASDKSGATPILVAKNNKHQQIVEFLQRHAKAVTGNLSA